MDMEWNTTKWDWENLVNFGPKVIDSPKKLQLADWMVVEDGEFHGSHNLSGGSSAKSSISASTDSSTKEGVQTPSFRFEGTSGNLSKKMEVSGTSNASVGSTEALLGLKLGKRTYFENNNGGSAKSSTSLSPTPTPATTTTVKKTKSSAMNAPVLCQVEGCNIDLSKAKEYHRKHRVCDTHSKWPTVTVAGRERRFCQQCSRFHSLSEFDEKKRSCRRRLSDHNARRRKPQQETMQFDSTRLSTPFYGNQQMSFLFNNSALVHSKTLGTCAWDNSKFTLSKGYSWKSNGDGGTDKHLHMPGIKNPQSIITMQNAANGLPVSKNSTSLVSDPGSKGSMISPLDAAPEYRRALSLLSNNSWDSCEPESSPLHHHMQENNSTIMQPMIHAIPEGVPLSSSEFWLSGQHSTQSLPTNSNFQEIQLFKTPYDADFYSNMLN